MITMVMGLLTFDRCAIPVRGIDVAATSLAGLPKFADPAPACRQRTTRQALRAGSRSFSCAHPGLPRSRRSRCSTRSAPALIRQNSGEAAGIAVVIAPVLVVAFGQVAGRRA